VEGSVCKLTHLTLYVGHFTPGELKLADRYLGLFQIAYETEFLRLQDKKGVTHPSLTSGSSTNSVNIFLQNKAT